jgi:hypothetical protein
VIRISGTGQRQQGWCDGIMDNIHGECGLGNDDADYKHCLLDNEDTVAWAYDDATGEETKAYGIDLNLHIKKWSAGEDEVACITTAIRKGTCTEVWLSDYKCYKHPDSK